MNADEILGALATRWRAAVPSGLELDSFLHRHESQLRTALRPLALERPALVPANRWVAPQRLAYGLGDRPAIDAFASRTGTRRNLDALRAAGWGLFVTPVGAHRNEGFRFIIDNSAWTVHMGLATQAEVMLKFEKLLEKLGRHPLCEGIVAPDIVCGGAASLRLSLAWLDRLLTYGPRVYLVVQPGITPAMLGDVIGERVAIFVGGDSAWKEETIPMWVRYAHDRGALCHVGRVNSHRRLMLCKAAGVDSFDGSGPSRFAQALVEMERSRSFPAQIGLGLSHKVWCLFGRGSAAGEYLDIVVMNDLSIAGILHAVLVKHAAVDDVFEVQTEAGCWELEAGRWLYKTWHELENEN